MVEFAATADPAVKTTVPPVLETGVAILRVFVSDVVEESVQVEIPEAFEELHVPRVFVDPVEVNVGTCPLTGLLLISFSVIVTVDVATPSAATGPDPVIVELTATGVPAVNVTVPPAFETGVAILSVFISAINEVSVQVATPEAFVEEQVP